MIPPTPRPIFHLPFALALLFSVFSGTAVAQQRHALVIGNGAYQTARKLPNAPKDARDVAAALTGAGWQVTKVEDSGIKDLLRALREFCESAKGAEAALFFYAGHGIEVKGKNYLLPVDASLGENDGEDALPLETLAVDKVLADLGDAGIALKTVVLDSCRNDPLQRSWMASRSSGGGLAEIAERVLPEGTMLVYSTAPGKTASDGRGTNSPFTGALLARMKAGGGGVADVFGDVAVAMGRGQEAWIRFDGSGRSFAAFRAYPLLPGAVPFESTKPPMMLTAADRLRTATKDSPFVNSLGMEFVPVPGKAGVFMCRTETRVRDFRAYAEATDFVQTGGTFVLKVNKKAEGGYTTAWELDEKASWVKPGFSQSEDHPVVCVSLEEARAMAAWLSKEEKGLTYRLPTDAEWSAAVGSVGKYPWGNAWPPPKGAGNFWDKEAVKNLPGSGWDSTVAGGSGYDDGAERTARVATFTENRFSFFDLGGNVSEWCEDLYKTTMNDADALEAVPALKNEKHSDGTPFRVLRGGSWRNDAEINLRSSCRFNGVRPTDRYGSGGFRLVVSVGVGG